jgi:tetratricopeptide (TPR) repeat protein
MVLYVREQEYPYALEMARQLHRRYPDNYILHLNQAQILERMGGQDKAVKIYMDVVRAAEEGRRGYKKLPLGTFRYTMGSRLWSLGYPGEALEIFQASGRDPKTPSREKVLSHLRAGEILHLMGRRTHAASHYREIQMLEEVDDSHSVAAEYLRREQNP